MSESAALGVLCEPVRRWFEARFAAPTPAQAGGWPVIAAGENTLIAAPTGTGKTLSAFLVLIDRLVRRALAGELQDALEAVYVSPLRALSHDIQANLEQPLAEIRAQAAAMGLEIPEIRSAVRTGDTPAAERQALLRRAPHILVTTPESLYLLLTSERARAVLRSVRTVIVDEIHALARDKRGAHLALSLERLEALTDAPPQRLGLSATQRPIEEIARFLVGRDAQGESRPCRIVDTGHRRELDLAIELPRDEDLCAVASNEQWDDLLRLLIERIEAHRTTLIFVNTRRLAERLAHRLREKLGEDCVAAHHGSLARERRLRVERMLREGALRALVATASLELGIDIGEVDLVCQIGSPRSIATFLQRVGRSGHALGRVPKGRLLPTSRDELVEAAAVVRAAHAGRLDAIRMPEAPLDILAQQIVAACACENWSEAELLARVRRAHSYAGLTPEAFESVLEMLASGFDTARGRRAAYLYRDRAEGQLRARRGARLAAIRSGGAIPDTGDYRVVLDPSETFLGTVGEDFAIESMAGDVFLLGTHTWRVRRVEAGTLRVTDAQGAPPTIPFWVGEAPSRTEELSREVSELRCEIAAHAGDDAALLALGQGCGLDAEGTRQLCAYVLAQREAVGFVPSCDDLLAERFFDEAGGMQLVLHSPHGTRLNRALVLALRKRFCRAFNQELQCAATDDAAVISLGPLQSFALDELEKFLPAAPTRDTLEQAVLGTPLFGARWRWNANRALAVPRFSGRGKVPFAIQRMQAEDLLAGVFPEQTACQEHVTYPIQIPEHPLVRQTLHDCLHEALDVAGLDALCERHARGELRLHVRETVEPSPFSHEILNARPYAFLDDAPLEERRTRAVSLRRVLPEQGRELTRLDAAAIERVRREAQPHVRDADELLEWLVDAVLLPQALLPPQATPLLEELLRQGRACRAAGPDGALRLCARERLAELRALHPQAQPQPALELPTALPAQCTRETALAQAVAGHMLSAGPITAAALAARLGVAAAELAVPLAELESRGRILRGRFTSEAVQGTGEAVQGTGEAGEEYCDRGLLARIHRATIARLRSEIEPVSAQQFLRFLLGWQGVASERRALAEADLLVAIERLSGFEAPAAAWEAELLPARAMNYTPALLDALCLGGAVSWGRLRPGGGDAPQRPSRATPIALVARGDQEALLQASALAREAQPPLRGTAARIAECLEQRGALFARDLEPLARLPVQLDEGLRELVALGLLTCDGFAPLRRLFSVEPRRGRRPRPTLLRGGGRPVAEGRWSLWRAHGPALDAEAAAEASAWRLLRRYGVVFRDLLAREWLPAGWREVHRALRRLEARGEVRGGRFVQGFIGEQFALPEAIPALRAARGSAVGRGELRVCAADPLNLVGILTPGPRIAATHTRWIALRDGLPVALVQRGGHSEPLPESASEWLAPGVAR